MSNNGISQVLYVIYANTSNMRLRSRGKEDERPQNSSC